jgi:hypothetical protein
MGGKSIIALLVPAFAALLWALVKDTYVAVAIEEATGQVAEYLRIPRAAMIAAATPYILALGVISATAVTAYQLGTRDRQLKPAFEFVYDENNPHWVQTGLPGHMYYFIGLHILSPRTVDFPKVWMLKGPLTQRLFAPEHPSGSWQIYQGAALDPGVTESVKLFNLPPERKFLNLRYDDDPIGSRQIFTLEARGRNCKAVTADFEYDPDKTPMVRMLT